MLGITSATLIVPASSTATKAKAAHGKRPTSSSEAFVLLRDRATGFTVRAPRDFKITRNSSNGVEEVSSAKRDAFVTYLLVTTSQTPSALAETLIAQSQSRVSSSSQSPTMFKATIVHNRRTETLLVRRIASGSLAVTIWGITKATSKKSTKNTKGHGRPGAHKSSFARTASVSLQRLLPEIASTTSGGHAVTPPIQSNPKPVAAVALQSYTNEDKSASAQVPVGFHCTGKVGIVECSEPAHGELEYGVGAPVCTSGMEKARVAEELEPSLCPVTAPFMESPAAAATTIWPGLLDKFANANIQGVTVTSTTPEQMGPGWNAALEILSFTRGGVPWTAAMFAATTAATGSPEEWLFYYSEISVPKTGASSYGQALAQSWASFNPSAAEQQRASEAEHDMQATAGIIKEVNGFRQEVFTEANQQWDEYIREEPAPDDFTPDLF